MTQDQLTLVRDAALKADFYALKATYFEQIDPIKSAFFREKAAHYASRIAMYAGWDEFMAMARVYVHAPISGK